MTNSISLEGITLDKNKDKFPSKKDFSYWIIILGAVIIFLFVWRINEHEEVVNQISLVGSVSSILLALIAIAYAFFQTNSTQLESKKMLELLEKLDSKVDELEEIKLGLSNIEGEFSSFKKNSQDQSSKLFAAIQRIPDKLDISPIYKYLEHELNTSLSTKSKQNIEKIYKEQVKSKVNSLLIENEVEVIIINYIAKEVDIGEKVTFGQLSRLIGEGYENDLDSAINKFINFGILEPTHGIKKLSNGSKLKVTHYVKAKNIEGIFEREGKTNPD
ncbi:hypothetical protein P5F80_10810 [Shouchella clausii]|uniref:hypothetical protein n=1 Tax=Shouchella clausii TaxID=79880 RepID=UPI002E21EF6F|nr:hypothetical protein [Shouchella clausii]MED4177016.1 hypothetical protein [Shouchella clausii]